MIFERLGDAKMYDTWLCKRSAESTVKFLKTKSEPDGRLRNPISMRMQEIYLLTLKTVGIRLDEVDLIYLWEKNYLLEYRIKEREKKYRDLLILQNSVSRRVKRAKEELDAELRKQSLERRSKCHTGKLQFQRQLMNAELNSPKNRLTS
jgi:hypothetical protein